MKRWAPVCLLAVAGIVIASAGHAGRQIDTAHAARDRQNLDACILRAVVIYTDPYIGARLSHEQVLGDIADMCAAPFAVYSTDLGPDVGPAASLLRRTIEAGLRGQLRGDSGRAALRDAR